MLVESCTLFFLKQTFKKHIKIFELLETSVNTIYVENSAKYQKAGEFKMRVYEKYDRESADGSN